MTAPSFVDTALSAAEAIAPSPQALAREPSLRGEFIRYLACSAAALAIDFGTFSLALRLGLDYPPAAALGFLLGLWVAYALSVRFAFRDRSLNDRRVEFVLFALIGLVGLLLTELLLWLFIDRLRQDPHLAKLLAAGHVFLFNFTLRKFLLFRKRRQPERAVLS